ncbi:MAG: hypothetical protein JWO98_2062 [Frankiales bacterium]|nr:hypothetical protein [Frankiales bacterium]
MTLLDVVWAWIVDHTTRPLIEPIERAVWRRRERNTRKLLAIAEAAGDERTAAQLRRQADYEHRRAS